MECCYFYTLKEMLKTLKVTKSYLRDRTNISDTFPLGFPPGFYYTKSIIMQVFFSLF